MISLKGNKPAKEITMPQLLSYHDVAELTRIPLGTLYSLVNRRRIPHIRLGPRLVRFSADELNDWLAQNHVGVRDVGDEGCR